MALKGKTVLILTGGGETQVLNATILGAVMEARSQGMRVLGGLQGWACLLGGKVADLTTIDLTGVEDIGGTFLRTSRTNPLKEKEGPLRIMKRMAELKVDYLLPIGGDDTLGAASLLSSNHGVPLVAAPKTADNDLGSTHFTPGFPSAAWELAQMVNRLRRDCAIPRHRIFLIESQGGKAGWLPASGILGGAHMITVPEHEVPLGRFLRKAKEIYEKEEHLVIVVSKETRFDVPIGMVEDQGDGFGVGRTRHIVVGLQEELQKAIGASVQTVTPSNFIRSGKGHPMDIVMSQEIGAQAIRLMGEGRPGTMATIIYEGGRLKVGSVSLGDVTAGSYHMLPKTYYSIDALLPTKEYGDYLETIFGEVDFGDGWYYSLMDKLYKG